MIDNDDYLNVACLRTVNSTTRFINLINANTRTIDECYLNTYMLLPAYLAFLLANAYSLGASVKLSRLHTHQMLSLLRVFASLAYALVILDVFTKYFTDIYNGAESRADAAKFNLNDNATSTLVIDLYKFVAFSLNFLIIFNKNLFRRAAFQSGLFVSQLVLLMANLAFLINRALTIKNLDILKSTAQKFDFIKLFVYNVLLGVYLFLIMLIYKYRNLRVVQLGYASIADDPTRHVEDYTDESEEDRATYVDYLTFEWIKNLMKKGFKRELNGPGDLCMLPRCLNIRLVLESFIEKLVKNVKLNEYRNNPIIDVDLLGDYDFLHGSIRYEDEPEESGQRLIGKNSLLRTLLSTFGRKFFALGVLKFLNDCLSFAGPLLLNQLVQFVEFDDTDLKTGLVYASALFLSTFTCAMLNVHFTQLLNKLCLRIRIALIGLVYRKSVITKLNELGKFSIGEVLNFMSIDCDSVVNAFPSFHSLWSLPFQIVITLYLLYSQIGLSFLVGVGFVIVLIPINKFISDFIGKVQTNLMAHKDERVNIMSEFLDGIRLIKFYSWEKYFLNRIDQVRTKELSQLRAKKYLDAGCVYFWATTPILMSVFTFTTYVFLGNKLTPSKVFTSLALFNMLISPLNSFPWVINGLAQAWVSLKRIQKFLNLENLNWLGYYSYNELESLLGTGAPIIDLKDCEFSWQKASASEQQVSSNDHENNSLIGVDQAPLSCLTGINVKINKGMLVGVVGKVGSGKTSLLHSLTAEIEKLNGKVRIDAQQCADGFAFVSQEAWIQGTTIRENILFGAEYDDDLYKRVINACALDADLDMLPKRDDTPVGENGICLSGGQKARVTLARACYALRNKEVFLLDDPLSAVDAHVAKHIFTHCITGLLGDKTRILCTHHYNYLVDADLVLVLENGRIVRSGPGADIIPNYLSQANVLADFKKRENVDDADEESSGAFDLQSKIDQLNEQETVKRDEEEKEHGVISFMIYEYYCKSIGVVLSILTIVFIILMQASRNLTDFWLSYWTQHHSDNMTLSKTFVLNPMNVHFYTPVTFMRKATVNDDETKFFLIIYLGLCGANTVFTFVRAFIFAYSGVTAGKRIHETLVSNINKASLKFFDLTPRGRILNRLSSDMYAIDDSLPFILNIFLACLFGLIGILAVTCYSLPWFSIILVPLFIIYFSIQNYYRWTSRELKRISSVSLSPVYNHFHETIKGIMTIRSFRKVKYFLLKHETYLMDYIRASYASLSATQWLHFRLQMLSIAMITAVGFTAVFQHIYSTANASLIGLALSYILTVTGLLNGLITSFTETEKEMVSVERAHQFQNLDTENWTGPETVADSWPERPSIEFVNVDLRYQECAKHALENVTFRINPGEKIGICGRTGSGKSSLFMALFRGVEIDSGAIKIDNVNTRNMNLQTLRERLGIIPQDPFLFKSTLRVNLDPSESKTDDQLWSVLADVHLAEKFRRLPDGLDTLIEEKGKNLSSGEKQLVCLARAILSERKIICIDEATSSVDFETDKFIQETIRTKFRNVTVLTIAHRINTIFDYDRILVMNNGQVAEFDLVSNLLTNKTSLFYSLANESQKVKN